jgi:chitodextrinase
VRATDAAGNLSGYSPVSIATTQTSSDTQPPTAPGALTATAVSTSQINLSWTASTDNVGVTGYRIERCQGAGCSNFAQVSSSTTGISGPLKVSASNPRYFVDANGNPIVLAGSHTWNDLQDWGMNGSPQALNFTAYLNFLASHGHNFTLLWRTELPVFCGLDTGLIATNFKVVPQPYLRTGPGNATDGGLQFDLTQFDQSFFNRVRSRVQQLGASGIYAGVYFYTGEWLNTFRCSGDGYPLTWTNNVNGIDDGGGIGSVTMTAPNALTNIQDAYVNKMVDTLNDLPNVVWIVSEESPVGSTWWNQHQISHLRAYEGGKPLQHPIGWAVMADNSDATIYNSNADWVAPAARISPVTTCGTGTPACKVNVNDSDHSYFGMWNDSAQTNRQYAWENFTSGNQVIFMDPYMVYYPNQNRNLCLSQVNGICSSPDPRWDNFRDNLGYLVSYSRRLSLSLVSPQPALCSTGYCLAQTPAIGAEYLVYAPSGGSFTVNLSATTRVLNVEWMNPSTGAITSGGTVTGGSSAQSFAPSFSGDAVLYLVDAGGHAGSTSGGQLTTTYSDTSLTANTSYSYRVLATDAAGNVSPYSNIATASTQGGADVQPPTAPGSLTATAAGPGQINLSWTASSDNVGVAQYLIESCQGAGCTSFAQIGTSTTLAFSNTGLASGTSYSYRVRAADAAGNLSAYSNTSTAITPATIGGLVAAYAFSEGTGTTVADSSGNGNTGTIVGATWTNNGKYGSALSFNGSSSYVDLGNSASLGGTGSMTWSAWINAAASLPDDGMIVAKSDSSSGWQLKTSQDSGPSTFGVAITSGSRIQRYSNTIRALNTWYHVAGVYDASAKTLSIYVNGVLDNGAPSGVVPASQVSSSVNANIGRRSGGLYFNGLIDEVRIYNRALSQAEIQSDMNTPVGN